MAGYIGSKASVVTPGAERKKVFSITTTTTSLTGLVYTPGFVHVYHNGVRLVDGTDYTATNGTSITLTTAAQNGDEVVVISFATFQTSDTVSASAGGTFSNDVAINGDITLNNFSGDTSTVKTNRALVLSSDYLNNSGANQSFIQFDTDNTERMRITSDGDIGINIATPLAPLHINRTDAKIILEDSNNGTGGTSYTPTLVFNANGDDVGSIGYTGGNLNITTENFNNSAIRFVSGGSERMRIDSNGDVDIGSRLEIGDYMGFVDDSQHIKISAIGRRLIDGYRATSSVSADIVRLYTDVGTTESLCFLIEADGDVFNTNNSYGGISDERYKQDIVDAQSQWDDIKSLEIKNYRLKDMVEQCGDEAPVHLGVIAQQLEAAGMNGLVNTKVDEETGIETKSVKYSVLYMKAIGALQEAMDRIEALEAEVAALKGGA